MNENIEDMKQLLLLLSKKVDSLERKIDKLTTSLDEDVLAECKKMGSHINFIETVYENVKHPLGYICNRFHCLTNNTVEQYTLTDVKYKDD